MITDLGTVPLSVINPATVAANAALAANAGAILPNLTSGIAGAVMAQAQLVLFPPTLSLQLADATSLLASITLAISAGAPPVDVQLAAVVDVLADLTAQAALLSGQVGLAASLAETLNAGVVMHSYNGAAQEFGAKLRPYTHDGIQGFGSNSQMTSLVIGTGVPGTVAAMADLFGVDASALPGLNLLGEKPLSYFCPGLNGLVLGITGNLNAELPGIEARITGILEAQAQLLLVPPTPITQLAFASDLIATLTALIDIGVPSADAQLSALASLLVAIQSRAAALQAQIDLTAGLTAALASLAAGVVFDGQAKDAHAELGSVINNGIDGGLPTDTISAIILSASSPVSVAAMRSLFGI